MKGIAFFDSGVGGLTVLAEFVKRGCSYPLYYYGDNRRAPYGNRSREDIYSLTRSACKYLLSYSPKAIVLACNTATAVAIDRLRGELPLPVIGVEPALKPACKTYKRVLLLCTAATAREARVLRLKESFPQAEISVQTPAGLASAVEEWVRTGNKVDLSAHLKKEEADAVVLGCTHYVFLKEEISRFYSAPALDCGEGVYRRAKDLLGFSYGAPELYFLGDAAGENRAVFTSFFGSSPFFLKS